MLVLARGIGQSILIGEEVTIIVVDIKRDKVKLGITAPKDLRVDREEIRKLKDESSVQGE